MDYGDRLKILLFYLIAFYFRQIHFANGANTVGKVCQSNDQCMKNEFCYQGNNTIDPQCPPGRCHCLPGYEVQKDCSLEETCTPIQLNVGDKCCQWLLSSLPLGTRCRSDGRVECNPPYYYQSEANNCILPLSMKQNSSVPPVIRCLQQDDCFGGLMTCSRTNFRCQCPSSLPIYDPEKRHCTPRDYGDPCTTDNMCNEQGYTFNLGTCNRNGTCACANSSETVITYLNRYNGRILNKTVCLPATAITNGSMGSPCHLDPVLLSKNGTVPIRTCSPGLICYQCPGDRNSTLGICRTVKPPPANSATVTMTITTLLYSNNVTITIINNSTLSYANASVYHLQQTSTPVSMPVKANNGLILKTSYKNVIILALLLFHIIATK